MTFIGRLVGALVAVAGIASVLTPATGQPVISCPDPPPVVTTAAQVAADVCIPPELPFSEDQIRFFDDFLARFHRRAVTRSEGAEQELGSDGGSGPSSFHGIIGQSAPMQALFRRIERVTPIDVPVSIQGESGIGKELVASAIHPLSAHAAHR